jgi:prostatic aicd phosphatase
MLDDFLICKLQLFHPSGSCAYKSHVLDHLPENEEVQEVFIKPYKETFDYIQNKSGKAMRHPADMQDIYFIFKTENDMGLVMPNWTKDVFPEPTQSIASQVYGYHNFDPRVKQINSGFMVKKILDDSQKKIEGGSTKKIFLYSGHESTLGYMLNALGVTEPHVPPYGSAISFEVRKSADQFYIKLRYRNDTEATEPVDLTLPGCDLLCPIDQFLELLKNLIPTVSIEEACKLDEVATPDNHLR